jgi:hypothetical protein
MAFLENYRWTDYDQVKMDEFARSRPIHVAIFFKKNIKMPRSANSPRRFGDIQPGKTPTRAHSPVSTYAISPMRMLPTTRNQYGSGLSGGSGWLGWNGPNIPAQAAADVPLSNEAAAYAALTHDEKEEERKRNYNRVARDMDNESRLKMVPYLDAIERRERYTAARLANMSPEDRKRYA